MTSALLLVFSLWAPVRAELDLTAGPYILCTQRDQVTVYWHTNASVPSVLEYGTGPGLGSYLRDQTPKQEHERALPIQMHQTYYYRIHGLGKSSPTWQFDATFTHGVDPVPNGPAPFAQDKWTSVYARAAELIVGQYGQDSGICVDYGCGQGRLAWEIARRSQLRIIGFNDDLGQVMQARQILDSAGVYGTRVVIHHQTDLGQLDCRDYLANLIVSDQTVRTGVPPGTAAEMFRILRPDGGRALLGTPRTNRSAITQAALDQWLGKTEHSIDQTQGHWALIHRNPLPGAGTWDHFYANAANTATSAETGLTDTMQLLWYGQPGPRHITDRHNRPMASLYREGVMVTPGLDRLMAYDAYNGTRYWDMVIPESTRVAVLRDSAWVVLAPHRVYLAHGQNCVALGLRTGIPLQHYTIPQTPGRENNTWGYVSYQGDRLYGSSQQASASVIGQNRPRIMAFSYGDNRPIAVSESLFCRDRHSGQLRWTYGDTGRVIINPSITLGKTAMVFLESTHPKALSTEQARIPARTLLAEGHAFLVSLDPVTGAVQWRQPVALPFQHVIYLQMAAEQGLIIATGARDFQDKIHYDMHGFGLENGRQVWSCTFKTDYDIGASHGEQEQHPIIVKDRLYTKYCQVDLRNGTVKALALDQATRGCATISACATHVFARGSNPFMYGLPGLFRKSPPSARERAVFSSGKDGEAGDIGFIVDGAGCSQAEKGPLEARATLPTEPITQGTRLTSETRPGCWINIFPVGGLVMIPESSSGCSCDFPIQATMAFQPLHRSEAQANE